MSWRPEGWENPHIMCEECNDCHWGGDNCDGDMFEHEAYEAGADAMLEGLKNKQRVKIYEINDPTVEMPVEGGTLIFIPED